MPHCCLRAPLETIEQCWENPAERKLAINSLLGLWVKKPKLFKVTTSRSELDAPQGDSLKRVLFYDGDKTVTDWVSEIALKGPQTKYPLWLLVMSSEAARIGQAIWALEKLGIPLVCLGEFKTDSIAVVIQQKRRRETVKEHMRDIRYCDLHSLKDRYMPVAKRQRRLDDTIELLPIASDERVYRCEDMEDRDKMATRPDYPKRGCFEVQKPPVSGSTWIKMTPKRIFWVEAVV